MMASGLSSSPTPPSTSAISSMSWPSISSTRQPKASNRFDRHRCCGRTPWPRSGRAGWRPRWRSNCSACNYPRATRLPRRRLRRFRRRRAGRRCCNPVCPAARPRHAAPTLKPWPSEPVATSTNARRGVGWPSSSLVNCRSVNNSEREQNHFPPTRRKAAARRGLWIK